MVVLYEDNHIIAVNKTCNEIVQGDKTGDTPLSEMVKAYIKEKYNKPGEVFLGVTHRLDRPTSGVVLFARTSKALARLNEMFKSHEQIKKTYWAIVQGAPKQPEARLENWLVKNESQNKSYIVKPHAKDAKQAVLNYRTLVRGENYTLLEINLETGRHHQIRVQFSSRGHALLGDQRYGKLDYTQIALFCYYLSFPHPITREYLSFSVKTPNEGYWTKFTV